MSTNPLQRASLRWYVSAVQQLRSTSERRREDGFEIAQSMGIALLGLVVAAVFAEGLRALGVDVIARIRTEIGL